MIPKAPAMTRFGWIALALAGLLVVAELSPWGLRSQPRVSTPNAAPEFAADSAWFNSPPRTIEGLRGKAVLVQFGTFSCINWIRTLPHVKHWQKRYGDKEFVVVTVHTPEFEFEKDKGDVEAAIERLGITYPVVQDNQFKTWNAYGNQYWPAAYLIDKTGKIVLTQFGEGNYNQMSQAIAKLVDAESSDADAPAEFDFSVIGSPEMYFGSSRNDGAIVRSQGGGPGKRMFSAPGDVPANRFALSGTWEMAGENATLVADGGEIVLRFRAPKVNLVAGTASPQTLMVTVDGKPQAPVAIERSDMHVLYDGAGGEHILRLTIPKAGLSAYTFTFG
jgi:thiol-disulfide isomerase/thioredoxin